jgi:hypothetical protein
MASYRVAVPTLNLRRGPGKTYETVTELPEHKILDQLDVSDDGWWYHVRTTTRETSVEGWVSVKEVDLQGFPMDLPADAPWLVVAEREMGTTEGRGDEDNPRVVEYLRSTDPPGAPPSLIGA